MQREWEWEGCGERRRKLQLKDCDKRITSDHRKLYAAWMKCAVNVDYVFKLVHLRTTRGLSLS